MALPSKKTPIAIAILYPNKSLRKPFLMRKKEEVPEMWKYLKWVGHTHHSHRTYKGHISRRLWGRMRKKEGAPFVKRLRLIS